MAGGPADGKSLQSVDVKESEVLAFVLGLKFG